MLTYLALYVVIGIISVAVYCLTHVIIAEIRRYNALDYWREAFPKIEKELKPSKILLNLLIWPVRLIQIASVSHVMYDVYQYNQYIRREE